MRYLFALIVLSCNVALADVVVPAEKVENSVNIRLEPDSTTDVVGELRKGESLPHVSSVDGWHEVQLDGGATGFVSADWSRVEPDPVVTTEEVVEVAEDAEVAVEVEEVVEATVEVDEVVEELVEVQEIVEEAVEEVVEVELVEEAEPAAEPVPEPEPVAEPVAAPEPEREPVAEPVPAPEPEAAPEPRIKASHDYVLKWRSDDRLGNSQIFDDGNRVGIGTDEPAQRLDVNGSVQIHDRNSNVAGLMITASTGETGYVMHNRASTLTIGSGSIDRITIDRDGNVGIGVARPEYPLELANGAFVSAGGAWTNRSSRADKENIRDLSADEALAAVLALEPVSFNYKAERGEGYVGFVAEDVPALLAVGDGKSLSSMDIIAALTRVVQEQQRRIEALEAKLEPR